MLLSPVSSLRGSTVMLKLVLKPLCSVDSTTDITVPASVVWVCGGGGGGGELSRLNGVAP